MPAVTPNTSRHDTLPPLASRYVEVDDLPWVSTKYPGVEIKVLMEDEERGLMTALFRWASGAELPLHEHVEIEQTFVLSGSLEDNEGKVRAGNYVWRPSGSQHVASAPEGALVLSFFLRPNNFLLDSETKSG